MKIPEGQKLGGLCLRGHDYDGTGQSLRYVSGGACIECQRTKDRRKKDQREEAVAAPTEGKPSPRPRKAATVSTPIDTSPAPSIPRTHDTRVLGLLAEFCGGMPLQDFAQRLGISCTRLIELVMLGLDAPSSGGAGGSSPTSSSSPANDDSDEGFEAASAHGGIDFDEELPPAPPLKCPPPPAEQPKPETRVRCVTLPANRVTRTELRIGRLLWPERVVRPTTRGECANGVRPCPFVGCAFNLYLDVDPDTGSLKLNFPDREPWQMEESCALDVAGRGGATFETVGSLTNLTRERVRQIEMKALDELRRVAGDELQERFVDVAPRDLWSEAGL